MVEKVDLGVPETKTEDLPILELREVVKSKEKVGLKSKIQLIQAWNDYTICSINGEDGLVIFDDKLERIPDTISKVARINFREIYKHVGRTNESTLYSNIVSSMEEPFKSLYLRKFPGLKNSSWTAMQEYENVTTCVQPGDLIFLENEKYAFFRDSNTGWGKLIQIKDNEGIVLPPKDWVEVNLMKVINGEIATETEEKLFLHMGNKSEVRELNESYKALLTDVGLNIVRNGLGGGLIFSELLPSVGENTIVDPTNENILYFCQVGSPKDVFRLDMSGDPSSWKTVRARFPKQYSEIKNLQLDPTGTFFLFYSGDDLVMVTKDTLEEVKRMPGLSHVNFDSQGRIRAINKEGFLVLCDVDYDSLSRALAKRKAEAIGKGIDITNIFEQKKKTAESYDETTIENLKSIREEWEQKVFPKIEDAKNISATAQLRFSLNTLRVALKAQNLNPEQIAYVTEGIEKAIQEKEKEYAKEEAEKYITDIESKLTGALSVHMINELRTTLEKLTPIEGAMDTVTREKVHTLAEEVNKRAIELFVNEGSKVIEDLNLLMEGTRVQLSRLENKNQFDDWMEFQFPQIKARLGTLLRDCPVEAHEASTAIIDARNKLVTIAEEFKKKFELEYAKVREKATERMGAVVETLEEDTRSLTERLKSKNFKTREEAEQYLSTSEAKNVLEGEIAELAKNDPDAAKELERGMKVSLANTLAEIERGGAQTIAETGQQMVLFGDVQFHRYEGKVKEKKEVKVDLTFVLDEKSKGPGMGPKDFYGDVELVVTDSKGEKRIVRLYEGMENEDEWRLGLLSYRGDAIPSSYVKAGDFQDIKKHVVEWQSGKLKEKEQALREELSALFTTREKRGKGVERDQTKDEAWQKEYKEKLQAYGEFCAKHHIVLMRRIDEVKNTPEIDANGKGYVPKWQSHWVTDPTTEKYLEDMAKNFKMQLELQEGVLNLYGHAGTGKDVLIKMFASQEKTNRPYFGIDCTKWTTEYELAEDVVLEAKDGATQTVRIPSSVLTGIQTPGAIVYFNEFNAMPEQAQIFLHALFDEKRSMTLKTSSGKVVKALPSVLFALSMNPNYPGTFEPQFATKSRMVSMEIDYPSLTRGVAEGEPSGREMPFNSSEALRIARGTESLMDFTYEPNMKRNEFVMIWDKYINGINNEAPAITKTQQFDLDVIRALIQFADKFRQDFKKNFEKNRESRNALPVKQPLTLREMRRCAYELSHITDAEKLAGDSDQVARNLIERYFLSNIFETGDRNTINDALKNMTSKNRVMA